MLEDTGRFSLAVLNQRQNQIAMMCGSVSGRESDKCAQLDLYTSSAGFLFLTGALATTGCVVRHSEKSGDHTIFVADIIEAHLDSRRSHLRHLLISDLRD
jgi:flavin reductase (DIM6/NTAB) family NADH-FMN oxidoreductase RutF